MKKNIEIILLRIYIMMAILEGLIRYILNSKGLAAAFYIKDIIIVILFILALRKMKVTTKHIIGILFIMISFITSLIYINNIKQILFFLLKVLMVFLVGVLQYKNIIKDINENKKFYEICYIIVIIGIFLNNFITFPWEDLTYSIGNGIEVSASRFWTTSGIKRLSGFSRASFDAATHVVILSIIVKSKNRKKNILNIVVSIIAIWLTTTKGLLIAYIILNIINSNIFYKKLFKEILITVSIILMIVLPIFSLYCDNVFQYLKENLDSLVYKKYIASFEDRLKDTWPDAFYNVKQNGNIILGKGFGGFGVSESLYSDADTYTPGDNVFVYLYGTMGIISIPFLIWIVIKSYKLNNSEYKIIYDILCIIYMYGIVSNILEEPILCLYFGCSIGYLIKLKCNEESIIMKGI